MTREFCMPNSETFSMAPVARFIERNILRGRVLDPFARASRIADITNDLNPNMPTDYHLDAEDFVKIAGALGATTVLFDPPYSPRQISECYQSIGRECTTKDTQNAALYKRVRDAIHEILPVGGVVLSFGWSSNGMGKTRGYAIVEILLVAHGGAHNDTICLAEVKR